MFRHTDLPYHLYSRGEEGREYLRTRFLDAYMENNGNMPKVWEALSLTAYTWYRYVRMLGLKEQIRSLRVTLRSTGIAQHYSDRKPSPRAVSVFSNDN